MKRVTKLLILLAIAAGAMVGFAWTQRPTETRTTQNAYVGADAVPVATRVAGHVTHVHVKANTAVAAGDPLLDLDDRPGRVLVERAQAKLAQARLTARESQAELVAAEAEVKRIEHLIGQSRTRLARANNLASQGFVSSQGADDAQAQLAVDVASLDAARARVVRARAAAYADIDRHPAVLTAAAELRQAELDLEYTHVAAPAAGRATNLKLTVGTQVQANAPLFMLVAEGAYWVDANFKESELPGIALGQQAEVELDAMPGRIIKGEVESISPGTGAAFALLPPQNATGNWVKTAQRVPVRIRLQDVEAGIVLPIGTSATVTVHVR